MAKMEQPDAVSLEIVQKIEAFIDANIDLALLELRGRTDINGQSAVAELSQSRARLQVAIRDHILCRF